MATVCTVTPPAVWQNSAGVTEGQWDVKAQTHYQSKHTSNIELLLGERKLTLHTEHAVSVLEAESVNLLDCSKFQKITRQKYMSVINISCQFGERWGQI